MLTSRAPTVIFVINVDWFFVSHFLHLARAAMRDGYDVLVATEATSPAARHAIEDAGVTLVALPTTRGSGVSGLPAAIRIVADVVKSRTRVTLHGFGQYGILVGALAVLGKPGVRRVFTVTGRGFSAVDSGLAMRALRPSARVFCRTVADGPDTRWLVENDEDIAACGLEKAAQQGRLVSVTGAGVDATTFAAKPMPTMPPLRVALVSRLIWSKGVDLAVEAVSRARADGLDVTLTLGGDIDPANPRSLTGEQVTQYAARPGVHWAGMVRDVPSLWANHHIAILPSRGGEGVPKSLIEAAACGRPVLTSAVPGCSAFAIATGGWSVAAENIGQLKTALFEIAQCEDLAARGAQGRAYVLQCATEDAIWTATAPLYARNDGDMAQAVTTLQRSSP